MDQPYFRTDHVIPPRGTNLTSPEQEREEHQANVRAASRDASEREMAYLRALGGPPRVQLERLQLRSPDLPDGFEQKLAALDTEIFKRGLEIDRKKLLELGKEWFTALLAADRECRQPRAVRANDLSNFRQVQSGLFAFEATTVPRRTMIEQSAGRKKELDHIRQIGGWSDLWKAIPVDPETTRKALSFHDKFAALYFGQSMLEKVAADGKVHSRFLCGGRGLKVDLLREWLAVVQGQLVSVTLSQPLFSLMAWLAEETAEPPDTLDLARSWFNRRVPSTEQVRLAQAVLDGFLLDYRDWPLWEFVGRQTRTVTDQGQLETWRAQLAKGFPCVTAFHEELRSHFNRDVGYGFDSHRVFESDRHRAFLNGTVQKLLDVASALLAQGIEESFPGSTIARFQGSVLMQGKHKLKDKRVQIGLPLAKAFPAATFPLEEVPAK